MPTRKAKKPTRATKRPVSRKRTQALEVQKPKLPLLSLLILECDADLLARQSLSMANDIDKIVRILPKRLSVEVAFIKTKEELLETFADLSQKYRGIKLIVAIAHSNSQVISLAPGMVIGWGAFGEWIKPFNPQKLVFIACKAGQFPPTRTLFDEVEKLTEIYASPVELWKHQVEAMMLLIPYLLMAQKIDPDLITVGQAISFMRHGGIILRCRRRQTEWNQLFQAIGALRDLTQ
jgi:hypothetical protein